MGYDVQTGYGIVDAHKTIERLSMPVYYVKHSGVGGTPVQTMTSNITVNVANNINGIEAGIYFADRYTITNTFTDVFGPNETAIDDWQRYSSSNGVSPSTTINGKTNFSYTTTTSLNTTTVSTTTYCWHIIADADENPIDEWIPAPPDQIKTAYSLYVMNTDYVGLEDNQSSEGINIYPNPVNSSLTMSYSSPIESNVSYTIMDASGRIIQTDTKSKAQIGAHSFNIDVAHFSKGLYICTFIIGENVISKRFIKN